MGTIGIIAAMDEEMTYVKSLMDIKVSKSVATMEFFLGKVGAKSIVLVRSGIGKVNASVCTQILIDQFAVDYVLNIGIAGAICPDLEIGDIVISTEVCHHDVDATVFGYQPGQVPRMPDLFFKADERLIQVAVEASNYLTKKTNVYSNRIASGDQFISSTQLKAKIWKEFKAYCAEMEGASVAHTCVLNSVPFLIVRQVSDKADDTADVDSEGFMENYLHFFGELVEKMIELI